MDSGCGVSVAAAAINFVTAAATSHLLRQRTHGNGKASVDIEAALRYAQSVVAVGGWQTPLTQQTLSTTRAALAALVGSWRVAASATQPPAPPPRDDKKAAVAPAGVWASQQHAVRAYTLRR